MNMNMNKTLNSIAAAALLLGASIASAQTTAGTGASAQSGVAIGTNASQADYNSDFAGTGPLVNYFGGIAIGNGSFASGKNVAIGDGIRAPQDGIAGSYSFVIGGLNYNSGLIEFRRVVGMANGLFATDGAALGQVWEARDFAITTANNYTNQVASYFYDAIDAHDVRITNAQVTADTALTSATAAHTRLDLHDVILSNHDQRITVAQATADTALVRSSEALAVANQARQDVAALYGHIDEVRKDSFRGTAAAMAMAGALPNLSPGERAGYLRVGAYRGQAAVSGGFAFSNWAGQVFDVRFSSDGKYTGFSAGVTSKF